MRTIEPLQIGSRETSLSPSPVNLNYQGGTSVMVSIIMVPVLVSVSGPFSTCICLYDI